MNIQNYILIDEILAGIVGGAPLNQQGQMDEERAAQGRFKLHTK